MLHENAEFICVCVTIWQAYSKATTTRKMEKVEDNFQLRISIPHFKYFLHVFTKDVVFQITAWNAPNGEPNGGDGPHCLTVDTTNPRVVLWYDEACDKEYNAVCEVQVGKCISKSLCQVICTL